MVDYLARPVIHEAFYKKYASKKFLKGNVPHMHYVAHVAHVANNEQRPS